jgi:hypothetical protein
LGSSAGKPAPLATARLLELLEVARDELGHLEHTHLLLAVEDGLQAFVSIDQGSLLFVLQSMLANVAQSFLVSSVRGSGVPPTTLASKSSGCTGFMKAALGFLFDLEILAMRKL